MDADQQTIAAAGAVHADVERVLLSAAEIHQRVAAMGEELSRVYADRDPILVGVLRGAVVFLADLIRAMTVPVSIDFVATSSYGSGAKTSGVVRILKDLNESVENRDVILVEDIIDSGLTVNYLADNLRSRHARSVAVCALLDKPSRRRIDLTPDFRGFTVPDEFLVGYGLDYAQRYRNLPYIGVLRREVYE